MLIKQETTTKKISGSLDANSQIQVGSRKNKATHEIPDLQNPGQTLQALSTKTLKNTFNSPLPHVVRRDNNLQTVGTQGLGFRLQTTLNSKPPNP